MHKLAEKMADCLKAKVEGMGIDNIEGAALEELGKWVDIIKDIACYDKDMRIIKAMDESEENEEKMKYIEEYEDYPEMEERRYYRGQPRDSKGRYMSRRGRKRMGYEEPWDEVFDYNEMERMRDSDIPYRKMGYSNPNLMVGSSNSSEKNGSNYNGGTSSSSVGTSRYENARRGYEEKKTMGADKAEKMKGLEEYMKELSTDVSSMLTDMTPEEKTLMKQKLSVLMSKIQ